MCGALCQGAGTSERAALKKSTPFTLKNSIKLSKLAESDIPFCMTFVSLFISSSVNTSDLTAAIFAATLNLFAVTELISPL